MVLKLKLIWDLCLKLLKYFKFKKKTIYFEKKLTLRSENTKYTIKKYYLIKFKCHLKHLSNFQKKIGLFFTNI